MMDKQLERVITRALLWGPRTIIIVLILIIVALLAFYRA